MGIYNGSVSFSRYRVVLGGKSPSIKQLSELLDPFKAPKLKIDGSPKAETIGWVRPLTPQDKDLIDSDSHWDMSDCQVTGGLMLRVRYERRKVPSSLLQMLYRQKLAENTTGDSKPLGRLERQKLKESIAADLLRRTLPQIQFTDVLWRDNEQELLIFSASKTVSERILQLFAQTFGEDLNLLVSRLNAASSWIEQDDSPARLARLAKTEPTVFARQANERA
jgi:DNA recombination-dependent growth factor C